MIDVDTGELLAHRYCQYELNLCSKDDAGFKTLLAWCRSCVRGIRVKGHSNLALNILFCKDVTSEELFNGVSRDEFNKIAEAYLV